MADILRRQVFSLRCFLFSVNPRGANSVCRRTQTKFSKEIKNTQLYTGKVIKLETRAMKKLYGTAEYTKLTKYNFRIFVKLQ